MTVEDGYVLKSSDYPAVPKKKGFIGKWNTYDDPIHSDITITATYVRDDGTMSLEETEEYGLGSGGGTAAGSDIGKPVIYKVVTHEYLTQSGKVMRETVTTNQTATAVMDFVYDESGKPFALNYSTNGGSSFTTYYYVLNLQGDVVKLIDQDGAVAAAYAYDAWGNILSSSGSMAETNPLRYRGYYYDSETGFYYLQSRYYDPATRRFINADSYGSTGQGFIGTNMFAYCRSNPIMRIDAYGKWDINVEISFDLTPGYHDIADTNMYSVSAWVSGAETLSIKDASCADVTISPDSVTVGGMLSFTTDFWGDEIISATFSYGDSEQSLRVIPPNAFRYEYTVIQKSPDEKYAYKYTVTIELIFKGGITKRASKAFKSQMAEICAKAGVSGAQLTMAFAVSAGLAIGALSGGGSRKLVRA